MTGPPDMPDHCIRSVTIVAAAVWSLATSAGAAPRAPQEAGRPNRRLLSILHRSRLRRSRNGLCR